MAVWIVENTPVEGSPVQATFVHADGCFVFASGDVVLYDYGGEARSDFGYWPHTDEVRAVYAAGSFRNILKREGHVEASNTNEQGETNA